MGSAWMRSRWDRRIAGICGGIARNQGWNSTVIRLLWVGLVLFGGTGILAYLVLWVVMPEEPMGLPPYASYAPPPYPVGYGQPPYSAPPHHPGAPSAAYPGTPEHAGTSTHPAPQQTAVPYGSATSPQSEPRD